MYPVFTEPGTRCLPDLHQMHLAMHNTLAILRLSSKFAEHCYCLCREGDGMTRSSEVVMRLNGLDATDGMLDLVFSRPEG